MRIIPKKTKIGIELFKGISLADFLVGLLFLGLSVLALTSTVGGNLYIAAALLIIGVMLLVKIGDEPNYMFFLSVLRHLVYRKAYSKGGKGKKDIANLSSFKDISDGYIVYADYYGAAIEIPPVEFRFFSQYRRSVSIDDCLGNVLRSVNPGYAANIVKLERKVPYDSYIENEQKKLLDLRHCFECGLISEYEFQAKCEVVFDRVAELERMNSEDRTVAAYYYLVLFDSDKNQLRMQMDSAVNVLERGEMQPHRLNSKELALFLKYSNELDFNEAELDQLEEKEYARWAMPESVKIKAMEYLIDDVTAYTMTISNYPLRVGDSWLAGVMSIPATKVVVKLHPMDKLKTIRNIDRSISELRGRYNQTSIDSALLEISDHVNSLNELLSMLQSDNEVLLNTDVYVTCYDVPLTKKEGRAEAVENTFRASINNMRNVVRRAYREADLRLAGLQFNQMEGYIGSQISGYDPLARLYGRGIPGATAAAIFPWIFAHVHDPQGIKLGSEDGIPVFIDMFRRDSERVNSNVVIVGKSGSGKSYAAKSILVNLAADNSKIFVLDPENEYSELADNLHGKFINVGNALQGRINPFQIITALEDDDSDGGITGSYASHMQFLEEFYKQILPDCEREALEYLNTLTDRVYMHKGITAETNLSLLTPEDYPTFSNVYDEILKDFQSTDNEYLRGILRTLMNYVSKFSAGGRNANIWNGPSTISTDENFTVFNFQSLLSGGNKTITNAQMLLVMKYIDNEIIKNREYNNRYGTNRKIVVVIDEAHVFIDEKYPIALDFMYQLAKRIRKYNGMQIVITQNIKDFAGSEDLSRKSSAIINACQYSFIFSLAPNDMSDLCKLYEKAGGINELEQDKIVTAPRGNAFVILGPTSRSSFQVEVPEDVVQVFESRDIGTRYFEGEDGQLAWDEFVGDSRAMYLENRRAKELPAPSAESAAPSRVTFVEVSEEEYEKEQAANNQAIAASAGVSDLSSEAQSGPNETPVSSIIQAPVKTDYAEALPSSTSIDSLIRENGEAPAVGAGTAVTQAPVVQSIQTAAPESGEMLQVVNELRRMVDSMGRFSYDVMLSDIMSRIQVSGIGGQQLNALSVQSTNTVRQAEAPSRSSETNDIPSEDSDYEDEEFSADDFFNDIDDESDDEETMEEEPQERTLKEYFRAMALEEEATSELTDEEETTEPDDEDDLFGGSEGIDIMAFIEKSAQEMEQFTVLDDMITSGESKRSITLEELEKLNKSRKQS